MSHNGAGLAPGSREIQLSLNQSETRTAKLIFCSKPRSSLRKKMMPERGPRMDLWVVVVTISQYSKGLLASWVATKPLSNT